MLSKKEIEVYNRQISLDTIGIGGQEKLKLAKVLVVGSGGLGCPVLRYLAAAGVGEIGIIDFDSVSISNLHRQILFDFNDVDQNKAIVAKEKLEKINPFIQVTAYPERLTVDLGSILFRAYDIIVDCTDNYETRFLVNDLCVLFEKPFVYGSIYKFEGQISVFNFQNGPTYRCLFKDYPTENSIADCNSSGVLGVLPGLVGIYQANEVLKLILNIGEPLTGKLFIINGLTNQTSIFHIAQQRISNYDEIIVDQSLNENNYIRHCQLETFSEEIQFEEFKEKYIENNIQIIDVRDFNEFPIIENELIVQIPLIEIVNRFSEIDKNRETVLICKSGKRSQQALKILKEQYEFYNLKSYRGGLTDELKELLEIHG